MTEQDLGAVVVAWLTEQRWDVYQEVIPPKSASCADIVAVRAGLCWVIECKTSLGLSVIAQARAWAGWAEYRSVAVPRAFRTTEERRLASDVCEDLGIGVLAVDVRPGHQDVDEKVSPTLDRAARRAGLLRGCLCEEHKTGAKAGAVAGGRWTPFRATCRDLKRIVASNPGIPLHLAVAQLPEGRGHYLTAGTARKSLVDLVRNNVVDGVRLKTEGRRVLLVPDLETF